MIKTKYLILFLIPLLFIISSCQKSIKITDLTLEEKIGQMIITLVPSTNNTIKLEELNTKYHISGIILMDWDNDIKGMSRKEIKDLIKKLKSKSKIPLFIAADVEGGEVNRIHNVLQITTNQEYGSKYEKAENKDKFLESYKNEIKNIALTLKDLGINLNFAPVLDVEQTLNYGVLSKLNRSYSTNPSIVSKLGTIYMEELEKNGILTTAKHFPGHGHTDCDTYLASCSINVSEGFIRKNDLIPFQEVINKNISFVMVGLFETPFDEENIAILSSKVVDELLKKELNYQGIIITDDFMMGATQNISREKLALESILAGNDIILTTNPDDVPIIFNTILGLVESKQINETRIDYSVSKILNKKSKL